MNALPAVPALSAHRRAIIRSDQAQVRSGLNTEQVGIELGAPLPIVFGKRQGNAGGVWISAPAVLARFTNDTANQVTASYELVLTDGQITIASGDVYQGDVRLDAADWDVAYGERAGSWVPGNLIEQRFNVTTSLQTFSAEGKAIANDSAGALDLGGLTTAEIDQIIANARASFEVSTQGNYVTFFEVTIDKVVLWPQVGSQVAQRAGGFSAVAGGSGTGTISSFDFSFSPESVPWSLMSDPGFGAPATSAPRTYARDWYGQLFTVGNGWCYERGDDARFMPSATYTIDRPASTEAYGDVQLTFTEQIRPGFITTETLPGISLFGGLPPVRYDVTVEEINSEPLAKPEATLYCGDDTGSFSGVTTLQVTREWPAGDERWKRQVHAFARNGAPVPRLIEGTSGASNLFPDLARRLMVASSRVPAALIDEDRLLLSARFNNALDLRCDVLLANPTNLPEWLDRLAPLFLLKPSNRWGRIGLRPALPTTNSYGIETGTITPVATFDEQQLMGPPQISYFPRADRQPFAVLATWRDQPDDDLGVIQATEVRYPGEAVDGPYEDLDGAEYLTRELHAVRAAAYRLARRRHITHTLAAQLQPTAAASALVPGDIIRINQARNPTVGAPTIWSYLYEIESISGPPLGPWTLACTHFPVDTSTRSLVARDVANAVLS